MMIREQILDDNTIILFHPIRISNNENNSSPAPSKT